MSLLCADILSEVRPLRSENKYQIFRADLAMSLELHDSSHSFFILVQQRIKHENDMDVLKNEERIEYNMSKVSLLSVPGSDSPQTPLWLLVKNSLGPEYSINKKVSKLPSYSTTIILYRVRISHAIGGRWYVSQIE